VFEGIPLNKRTFVPRWGRISSEIFKASPFSSRFKIYHHQKSNDSLLFKTFLVVTCVFIMAQSLKFQRKDCVSLAICLEFACVRRM